MTKTLAQFSISRSRDGYVLNLEDEDGETTKFSATYELLDMISEAVDDQLNIDEADDLSIEEEDDEEGEGDEDR